MSMHNPSMRDFYRLFILTTSCFLIIGCKLAPVYNVENTSFQTPANTTLSDIKHAIIRSAYNAGWKAKSVSSRSILAGYASKKNKYGANVQIDFDRDSYSITYRDSRNLKYRELNPQSGNEGNFISGVNEFFSNAKPFDRGNGSTPNQKGPKIHKTYNKLVRILEEGIYRELSALSTVKHGAKPMLKRERARQPVVPTKVCGDTPDAVLSGQASITKSRVNLRTGAGTHCQTVGIVRKDDFFELLGKKNNWYYIVLNNGQNAWIYASLVKKLGGNEKSITVKYNNISADTPPPPPVAPLRKKISIAVIRFKTLNKKAQDIALGDLVSEIFTTALVNSRTFKIIERAQLDKVIKEMEMNQTGFIDTTEAVEIGKMVNADAIITGSVALLAGQLQLNARIIDIESAYVISAETKTTAYSLKNIDNVTQEIVTNLSRKFLTK